MRWHSCWHNRHRRWTHSCRTRAVTGRRCRRWRWACPANWPNVARTSAASFLPRITLNGDAGFQARQLDDLDGWNAHRFSIGPAISLPIFQGGRLKANLALSRLQQQQSALQFRRTVLQAWHEVDDAIDGYAAEQQRTVQLHVAVDESETALGAARRQYQAGVVDMLDVLTTQRSARDNQAALANSQATAAIARVELYRALGGGW
ncbi:hypothetical protein G6F55_013511 [Rhizopus delemar]|nr:hypothetical protein G6F55_013511 [Rhizopus delemar]